MREFEIIRKTNETDITLKINIDGKGKSSIDTNCGFLAHMLTLFSSHSRMDLNVVCIGDSEVDFHHTTEDIAITLAQAIKSALGDKRGIRRYASFTVPMDEALISVDLDISGRGLLCEDFNIKADKVGDFDTELCKEFMMAFARELGVTLHIRQIRGENAHHIIEGTFKALARAMRQAVSVDEAFKDEIPSTKGVI